MILTKDEWLWQAAIYVVGSLLWLLFDSWQSVLWYTVGYVVGFIFITLPTTMWMRRKEARDSVREALDK